VSPEKNSIFRGNNLALDLEISDLTWAYVRGKSRA
jgi:hypothetical protein